MMRLYAVRLSKMIVMSNYNIYTSPRTGQRSTGTSSSPSYDGHVARLGFEYGGG